MPCGMDIDYNTQFWSTMYDNMIDDLFNDNPGAFPPCPLQVWNLELLVVPCRKLVNDPLNEVIKIVKCDYITTCTWYYKVCTDYSFNPPRLSRDLDHYEQGSGNCPSGFPDIPPPDQSPDDPWETNCFNMCW
jgi:hypothetical protein